MLADIIRVGKLLDDMEWGFINQFDKEILSFGKKQKCDGWAVEDLGDLEELLKEVSLSEHRRDGWKWRLDPNEVFPVRSLSHWIEERRASRMLWVNKIGWINAVPRKVHVFVWRVVLGRLPVRVELDKRGIDLDFILCPCCENLVESIDHNLVLCEKTLKVWDRIFAWWQIGLVDAFNLKDMLGHKGVPTIREKTRVLWEAVLVVTAYFMWKSRNIRVFKGKDQTSSRTFHDIQIKTFEWLCRRSNRYNFSWQQWLERLDNCGASLMYSFNTYNNIKYIKFQNYP
ncbi:reverse transcriptase domain, reverse transcriptase zinc-binding domain protein [Tanacetum coccineum]